MHTFPRGISAMLNVNNFVQDLKSEQGKVEEIDSCPFQKIQIDSSKIWISYKKIIFNQFLIKISFFFLNQRYQDFSISRGKLYH